MHFQSLWLSLGWFISPDHLSGVPPHPFSPKFPWWSNIVLFHPHVESLYYCFVLSFVFDWLILMKLLVCPSFDCCGVLSLQRVYQQPSVGVIGQRMSRTIPSPPHALPSHAAFCSSARYSSFIQCHYFHLFAHLSFLFPTFLVYQPRQFSSHTSLSRIRICAWSCPCVCQCFVG